MADRIEKKGGSVGEKGAERDGGAWEEIRNEREASREADARAFERALTKSEGLLVASSFGLGHAS
jgi:hypothetical protein